MGLVVHSERRPALAVGGAALTHLPEIETHIPISNFSFT
jgi:hypothetical protein